MCVHINIYMYIQFIYIHPIEIRIYICVEINYEESTHAMTKAVKSCNLPFASWRKAGDVVLVQVQRPPNQGSQRCTSHFKRGQEKADSHIQSGRQKAKGVNSSFLHLFVPLRSSVDGECPPHWGRQATLLSPPVQILFSARNTLTDTQMQCLFQAPCGTSKVAHKVNHHNCFISC